MQGKYLPHYAIVWPSEVKLCAGNKKGCLVFQMRLEGSLLHSLKGSHSQGHRMRFIPWPHSGNIGKALESQFSDFGNILDYLGAGFLQGLPL